MNGIKKFINNVFATPRSKGGTGKEKTQTDHNHSDTHLQNQLNEDDIPFADVLESIRAGQGIGYLCRSAVKLNFILGIILFVVLIYSLFVTWFALHPIREYFAVEKGRIVRLIPLSEPYQTNQSVIQFARDSINESFSIDFVHYKSQLENSRKNFTDKGFASFLDQLDKSGILNLVKEKRMNVFVSVGTGILTKKGVENGRYYWVVQVPVEMRLVGQATEMPSQHLLATIRVNRIDVLDSPTGIAINQLITKTLK